MSGEESVPHSISNAGESPMESQALEQGEIKENMPRGHSSVVCVRFCLLYIPLLFSFC